MKKVLFLLLFCSQVAIGKGVDIIDNVTPLQVSDMFIEQYKIKNINLFDVVDKEEKVAICAKEYIKKQSKSYAKLAQDNLYNLINNFDIILSKIYGKKVTVEEVTYEEKIELLAQIQCETYYKMGILK